MLRALLVLAAVGHSGAIIVKEDPNNPKWIVEPEDAPYFVSLYGKKKMRGDCAGAIIGTHHVVTAAHCACGYSKKGMHVWFSNGTTVKPVKGYLNPDRLFNCKRDGPNKYDVAVLEFEAAIASADVALPVYQSSDEVGQTITIYGFGITGTPDQYTTPKKCRKGKDDGQLRRAKNIVTSANGVIKYVMDQGGLEMEGIAQDGDSGGPAIIVTSGTRYVAGVNSGTSESNSCDWGSVDEYARLSEHHAFILSVLDRDGTVSPTWIWGGGSDGIDPCAAANSKNNAKKACGRVRPKFTCFWKGSRRNGECLTNPCTKKTTQSACNDVAAPTGYTCKWQRGRCKLRKK